MLSATIFLPLLGALVDRAAAAREPGLIRRAAAVFTGARAGRLAAASGRGFDTDAAGIQWPSGSSGSRRVNIQYFVGVDGLSLPLVVLTTLLTFLAVLASLAHRAAGRRSTSRCC